MHHVVARTGINGVVAAGTVGRTDADVGGLKIGVMHVAIDVEVGLDAGELVVLGEAGGMALDHGQRAIAQDEIVAVAAVQGMSAR